jgi:hypothetical protein
MGCAHKLHSANNMMTSKFLLYQELFEQDVHNCLIICSLLNNDLSRISGSHSGGYEEYHLMGYNAVYSVECQPTFRRNISPPSSGSKK